MVVNLEFFFKNWLQSYKKYLTYANFIAIFI